MVLFSAEWYSTYYMHAIIRYNIGIGRKTGRPTVFVGNFVMYHNICICFASHFNFSFVFQQ